MPDRPDSCEFIYVRRRHSGRHDDPRVARQPADTSPARRGFCATARARARLGDPERARGGTGAHLAEDRTRSRARRPGLRCSRCSSLSLRLPAALEWLLAGMAGAPELAVDRAAVRAGAAGDGAVDWRLLCPRSRRAAIELSGAWILAAVLVAAMPGACRAVQRRRRGRLPRSTAWWLLFGVLVGTRYHAHVFVAIVWQARESWLSAAAEQLDEALKREPLGPQRSRRRGSGGGVRVLIGPVRQPSTARLGGRQVLP